MVAYQILKSKNLSNGWTIITRQTFLRSNFFVT